MVCISLDTDAGMLLTRYCVSSTPGNSAVKNYSILLTTIESYYIKCNTVVTYSLSLKSENLFALSIKLTKLCCF